MKLSKIFTYSFVFESFNFVNDFPNSYSKFTFFSYILPIYMNFLLLFVNVYLNLN